MKIRSLALVIVGALLGAGAVASPSYAPKSFHVGIGGPLKTSGRPVLAATATGGSLTVGRLSATTNPDGSASVTLTYANASGQTVTLRNLRIPADRTQPILDQFGNQVSATVPAALGTAIDSFGSNLDTQIGNAATAGKLNL